LIRIESARKENLKLCSKCYGVKYGDHDWNKVKQYWLNYGVIKEHGWKGQVIETKIVKSCGHTGNDCYNCEACKKIVGVKQTKQPQPEEQHNPNSREREREHTNLTLWMIGGIGILLLVGIIAYFLGKNKGKQNVEA
jgi:ABC-type cobalt transport system substrate-binding protein